MLAVIELGGNQFIVQKWDIIDVKKQNVEPWNTFDIEALLVSWLEGEDIKIWDPYISWSKVECKVLDQTRGEKMRVFKMKSKKRYQRNKGFKPFITQLEIMSIQ